MNSMSKGYYNDDCDHCKKDDRDHCKKEKKHCPTILKCGPVGGSIPVPASVTTTPVLLTTVAVNAPKWCDPCVKIEYASTVSFDALAAGTATFTVTIFKNCPNSVKIPVGSYTYRRVVVGTALFGTTDTFSFFVCDCNTCSSDECCYYSAEITSAAVAATTGTAAINGPALSALVVSSDCHC